MRRHRVRMSYLAAVNCGLVVLVGLGVVIAANAQQPGQFVIDAPIPDQTVATATLHHRFTPPLANRLDQYLELRPGSRLWDFVGGDRTHPDFPAGSQWVAFVRSVMRVMWHVAMSRPAAKTGCVRFIEHPAADARDRFGNPFPGEILGSRVWVRALHEVRRYRTADFYANDVEEVQRYAYPGGSLLSPVEPRVIAEACPPDPGVDRWPGSTTGSFPSDQRPLASRHLSPEQLERLRHVLREGVSCPALVCESAEGFIVRPVDLDDDGQMEYVVIESWRHCGSGGCSTTLLAFKGDAWVPLAEASSIDVLATTTNGFRDIVLGWKDYRWDDIAKRWRGVRFTWNGSRYVETAQRGELSVVRGYAYPPPYAPAALIIPPSRSPDADERSREEVAAIRARDLELQREQAREAAAARERDTRLRREQLVEAYRGEVKRRIEDKWVYPQEASRKGQSGQGEVRLVIRQNGSLESLEMVRSTGTPILDRYVENAIRLALPFPSMPAEAGQDPVTMTFTFTYQLDTSRRSRSPGILGF